MREAEFRFVCRPREKIWIPYLCPPLSGWVDRAPKGSSLHESRPFPASLKHSRHLRKNEWYFSDTKFSASCSNVHIPHHCHHQYRSVPLVPSLDLDQQISNSLFRMPVCPVRGTVAMQGEIHHL